MSGSRLHALQKSITDVKFRAVYKNANNWGRYNNELDLAKS